MTVSQRLTTGLDTPGGRIRLLRASKQMTQGELARRCFVTQPAVSQWERNLVVPDLSRQLLIAQALDSTRPFIFEEPFGGAAA